jgi:hypothetical protein
MLCDTVSFISSLDISDHGADETIRRFFVCLEVTTGPQKYRRGFMSLLNLESSLQTD